MTMPLWATIWMLIFLTKFCSAYPSNSLIEQNRTERIQRIPTSPKVRSRRQDISELCDFGTDADLTTCMWNNRNGTALKWEKGAGTLSNWLGGPKKDSSNSDDPSGGYAFFETSLLAAPVLRVDDITIREGQNAYLESPILFSTGAEGKCLEFSFAIDGLSASGLRVVLQPVGKNGRPESFFRVLWGSKDPTNKMWTKAEVLFTYNKDHQIVFEGVAKDLPDPYRKYRGYVAVDNIVLKPGPDCVGHCTFEGSNYCGWTNEENDDFNWSLGRGSRNPSTGPATDRSSFIYGGMEGGYAYLDSSYPRRPGDIAKLASMEFDPTEPDQPMCLRFWTHMYGNGIGTLSVLISDTRERQEREIWSLKGEAGNAWYQAEVTVSSANSFKIVIMGTTGKNNLGDIAVDDVSLAPGSCPTAPQIAAPGSGDCTFEVDECGWSNVVTRERLDDIDWERTTGQSLRLTARDHTLGTEKGYIMALARTTIQRPGSRAWFTSRDLKVANGPRCLTFWFIMNEAYIDNIGPSLGALTIYTKASNTGDSEGPLKPVWRLYNHQGPEWQYGQALIQEPNDLIVIEGIWGSSRTNGFIAYDDITFFDGSCSIYPSGAMVRAAECRFERDMCGWSNGTDKSSASWRLATISRRPANLPDKTFGAPDGYIYYDLFNQILGSNMVRLISPMIPGSDESQLCLSFWYAAFGAGDSALMQVIRQDNSTHDVEKIWSLEAKNMDTTRPSWMPAQVTVDSGSDFHIILEGQATNGGYAVDDITFTPGSCPTRPDKADVKNMDQQNL